MSHKDNPIEVRPASARDIPTLSRFLEEIEARTLNSAIVLDRLQAIQGIDTPLLAVKGGQALGFACLRLAPHLTNEAPQAEITELYVKYEEGDRQITRALLMAIEKLAIDNGATQIILHTGLRNGAAQNTYHAMGYQDYALAMRKFL